MKNAQQVGAPCAGSPEAGERGLQIEVRLLALGEITDRRPHLRGSGASPRMTARAEAISCSETRPSAFATWPMT